MEKIAENIKHLPNNISRVTKETIINNDQNSRHYESEVHINFEGRGSRNREAL